MKQITCTPSAHADNICQVSKRSVKKLSKESCSGHQWYMSTYGQPTNWTDRTLQTYVAHAKANADTGILNKGQMY